MGWLAGGNQLENHSEGINCSFSDEYVVVFCDGEDFLQKRLHMHIEYSWGILSQFLFYR